MIYFPIKPREELLVDKKYRKDVQQFERNLMAKILYLHQDLKDKKYIHGAYYAFNISDPKPRNIHKATVRDRLLHHALYRILYPYFDNKFIFDSYSCRVGKGTHKAINRLRGFYRKVSKNNTRTCWVHFPKHRVLRTSTKKRMLKKLSENSKEESKQSYLGMLKHGDTYKLQKKISGDKY